MTKEERIKKIIKVLEKVAKGDFDSYCEIENVEHPDEIDALALKLNILISDFKEYVTALKQKNKELEKLVAQREKVIKERTKELQGRLKELERFYQLTVGRELKMLELKKEIRKLKKELGNK